MHMFGIILPIMTTRLLRLSLLGVAALLMLAAPAAVWATDHKPAVCADQNPHKVRFVKVAPGVELQVLDWGGKGKAMVLLAGGGDNAHVYDQFAYQFTDYFHVIGITRRGYLPSSQPRNGYDIPTRAADDIAVLDALGIDKAVFVGHSAAGMELSRLGQAHKDRVDRLVYLDASDLSERYLPSRLEPPLPDYTDADLKSVWAYQAATARFQALRTPIPALCHGLKFSAEGAILDSTTPSWVSNKIDTAVRASSPTNWANIKAPRLGIFALFTVEARQAWYWYLSPAKKVEFDAAWGPIVDWHRTTIRKFAAGNSANTFLLPGAPHYVYITNEAEVVRWMRTFLGVPPRS
jgi:pimeloyl-ACP methyl ester carboxylesterase